MSRTTPCNLPFRVFYCPEYPLEGIPHDETPRPERRLMRMGLAHNIADHGLVNPLIVLNHPFPKCTRPWLMVGQNRLWALRFLGWTVAPAIVTGSCPYPATELRDWSEVRARFKDGEPYVSCYGIALRGTTPPESFLYPCP